MEVQTLPTSKPDVQITLSWEEAVELQGALARMFGNNDLYHMLHKVIRRADGDPE